MDQINALDLIIGVPLLYGFIKGIFKGLIAEIASIAAIVFGFIIAYSFSDIAYAILSEHLPKNNSWLYPLSYLIVFGLSAALVFFIGRALSKMAKLMALGSLDRILGGVFGFLKLLIIELLIAFFTFPILAKMEIPSEEQKQKSFLFQNFNNIVDLLNENKEEAQPVLDKLPDLDDINPL